MEFFIHFGLKAVWVSVWVKRLTQIRPKRGKKWNAPETVKDDFRRVHSLSLRGRRRPWQSVSFLRHVFCAGLFCSGAIPVLTRLPMMAAAWCWAAVVVWV